MSNAQTFHHGQYNLICSALACDNGMFRAAVVASKTAWPSRPRTLALRIDRHATAQVAIESARNQAQEWVRSYG